MSDSMWDEERKRLFGLFVRARRESLSPPAGKRRQRTPGLRREELAQRAGISAGWCVSIEQGRSTGISTEALQRLAAALELRDDERLSFFELAGRPADAESPPASGGWGGGVPAEISDDIAGVASPAFALDGLWNAVCWNERAALLFPDWLGVECDRNLLRYAFLNKEARRLFEPWQAWAKGVASDFRIAAAGRPETARTRDLIESLGQASPTFATIWNGEPCPAQRRTLWTMRRSDRSTQCFLVSRLGARNEGGYQALALLPFEAGADQSAGYETHEALSVGRAVA